jgi:hypothetical protein
MTWARSNGQSIQKFSLTIELQHSVARYQERGAQTVNHVLAFLWSRLRELNGLWDRGRWMLPRLVKVALSTLSATVAFLFFSVPGGDYAAFLGNPANYGVFFETIAVFTLLYSALTLWSTSRVSLVLERQPTLKQTDVALEPGSSVSTINDQAIVYNADVNLGLEVARNEVVYNHRMFEVHPLVREMLPLFLMRMPEAALDTSDDAKVRLYTDLSTSLLKNGGTIHMQRTSYYRDRLSNALANYRVLLDGRQLLDLRHEVLSPDGRLISLKESRMSNQLGGSAILVTSDRAIAFLRQGNRTAENPGRLAPAGSGSFDLPPGPRWAGPSFQEFARRETLRELQEECGLKPSDILAIQLCGFGRYLYRNGKPEVFCIATTKLDSKSIVVPVREWDYQQREVEVHGFDGPANARNVADGLADLQKRLASPRSGLGSVSGPLYWNVLFAREYLLAIGDRAETELFDGLNSLSPQPNRTSGLRP